MPRGKGNKATKGAPASPATPTTVTPSRSAFRSIAEADLAKAPGWLQRADDMNSFFWKMDVKQWRLVRRGGKKRSGVPELVDLEAILGRQKRVRVLGVVRNSVTGEERELQSEPLEEYTVQRLPGREGRDFEYRVWLQLTIKYEKGNVWLLLDRKPHAEMHSLHQRMGFLLQCFTPLLTAISNGPPKNSGVKWLWPESVPWDDVDAEMILNLTEKCQPGAIQALEQDPHVVKLHFLDTLEEHNYAGVEPKEGANGNLLGLVEHFHYLAEHNCTLHPLVKKRRQSAPPAAVAVVAPELPDDEDPGAMRIEDQVITCRICGKPTNAHTRGAGLQHFVYLPNGNVEEVELPACTPGLYSALAPALASSAEEVAVLRSVGCPLPSCRQTFAVPKRQLELEEHLQAHLADLHASLSGTSNAVHVANQVRLRTALDQGMSSALGYDGPTPAKRRAQ